MRHTKENRELILAILSMAGVLVIGLICVLSLVVVGFEQFSVELGSDCQERNAEVPVVPVYPDSTLISEQVIGIGDDYEKRRYTL